MKSVIEDIKTGSFKQIYLFTGQEDYLRLQYRDKLCKALMPEGESMNFSRFQGKGTDIQEVISLGETMPFFAPRRLIVLEDTGFFKSACPDLPEYLERLPEYLYLLFVETEVDKRNKLYKAVKKLGRVVEFGVQDDRTLTRWVLGMLKRENKKITQQDMELLLLCTGNDMGNIEREVDKLLCYTMDREVITAEDIQAVCTTRTTNKIFDMVRAVTERNQKKALQLYYDLLALKEPPMRILFLLARQFRQLLQVKELSQEGLDQSAIASKLGIQGFVARNCSNLARSYTKEALEQAVEDFTQAEEDVKTGKLGDVLSVELLIVKYSDAIDKKFGTKS